MTKRVRSVVLMIAAAGLTVGTAVIVAVFWTIEAVNSIGLV